MNSVVKKIVYFYLLDKGCHSEERTSRHYAIRLDMTSTMDQPHMTTAVTMDVQYGARQLQNKTRLRGIRGRLSVLE